MYETKIKLYLSAFFFVFLVPILPAQQISLIKINGASFFTEAEIMNLIKSRWFITIDSSQIQQDCETITMFYQDRGFLEATCEYDLNYSENGKNVTLIFTIKEGHLYRFGDIELSGLENVHSHFITNLLEFSSGMPFSKDKIVQSQLRAMQTGLFSDFEIRAKHVDSFERTISVTVNIQEKMPHAIDVGMGVDSEDGAKVFSGWRHRNINGKGRSISFSGLLAANYEKEIYFKKGNIGFVIKEPFFLSLPLDAILNSNYTVDKPKYVNFGIESYSTELLFDLPISTEYELILRGRLQNAQLFDIPFAEDVHEFRNQVQTDNNRFLSLMISRDTRDDLVDPTLGSFLSVTLEKAGGILGGDNDYNKIYILGSMYQNAFQRIVFAQQLAVGNIDLKGDIRSLPSYLRFFLGGSGSVRGYAQRQLGPRNEDGSAAGGNFLLLGNFELRYYLTYYLNLVTFIDAGNVWLVSSAASFSSLKYSTGIGFRLRTQFGFFRLDFGIKLSDFSTKDLGRIHFGFGQNF